MTNDFPPVIRLPWRFEPHEFAREAQRAKSDAWTPHFNTAYHDGGWSGIPLRAPAGAEHPILQLSPGPDVTTWVETSFLVSSPCLRGALARLACPLLSARLLKLDAGSVIREHRDHALGFEDGEVRLHVPLTSNPDVDFRVAGERVDMQPGEVWYVNVNHLHSVANRGSSARVHLVVDCVVDDWLTEQLLAGAALRTPPVSR